jgi:hypothetical protein
LCDLKGYRADGACEVCRVGQRGIPHDTNIIIIIIIIIIAVLFQFCEKLGTLVQILYMLTLQNPVVA